MLQVWPGGDPGNSIVEDTGAPVLAAHVMDGDFAAVQAASPGGLSWRCALSPEMAREYEFPEEWIGDPREVAEVAVAWAMEAGCQPDPDAVLAALVSEAKPADALVPVLMCALGFGFTEEIYLAEAGE
ncbi:hypothetical protein BX266_0050 [Streptomyces sp. TLI_171]|nr:hypothetical protein BX266_0050 [Streptomyces sp. TLI_171]